MTHDDQNNWTYIKNGVSVGTGVAGATFEDLKNWNQSQKNCNYWKGYIDEFKVYGRAFDVDDVKNACLLYGECKQYVAPATPDNLTASDPGSGTAIDLTWNSVNGADNYTIYWTSNPVPSLIHLILLPMTTPLPSQEPLRLPQGFQMEHLMTSQ